MRGVFLLALVLVILMVGFTVTDFHGEAAVPLIAFQPNLHETFRDETFSLNITVSNVTDLYLWVVTIEWNSTVLDFLQYVEGPFLKQGGETTIMDSGVSNGKISELACTLVGDVAGVNGSGTLITLTYTALTVGTTSVNITFSDLLTSAGQSISHETGEATIKVLPSVHDVAVSDLTLSETAVSPNETVTIHVTVQNLGDYPETFNLTVSYTRLVDPLIGNQTLTLQLNQSETLEFTWKPTTTGRYEIKAYTSEIPNDANPDNNVKTAYLRVSSSLSEGGFGGNRFRFLKNELFRGREKYGRFDQGARICMCQFPS